MERKEVYQAIDSERAYQDEMTRRSDRPDMIEDFRIGDALSALQRLTAGAHDIWYEDYEPYENTMEVIRKIAGVAVKMGERYGMRERKI